MRQALHSPSFSVGRRRLGRRRHGENGVLSPLPVGAGIDQDFVYGTALGENTFTVKAVDRAGNTSEASNPATAVLWPC